MDPEKVHIIYTAEDIQKYFSGKLSPAEMYTMEKAALDDAFLEEAMEGYEAMPEKDWDDGLVFLKDHFLKVTPASVVPLKPASTFYKMLKLAAMIVFLLGGVAVTYFLTNKASTTHTPLAVIPSKKDSISSVAEAPPVGEVRAETSSVKTAKINTSVEKQPVTAMADKKPTSDNTFIYRPKKEDKKEEKPVPGGGYIDDVSGGRKDVSTSNAAPVFQQNRIEEQAPASNKIASEQSNNVKELKKAASASARRFSAQVIGQDGLPLPFANVSIANENFGTYADARGKFRLVSPDSLLNVEIKSAGYISREFTLRSDVDQNKIVLAEDELALKEKTVVSGKLNAFNKTRRAVLVPDTVINVEPADGWA
ncbi:MAG: carboxypeptidase-like regulatory domain-containing protein, partial [Ferruginibacter sp.]